MRSQVLCFFLLIVMIVSHEILQGVMEANGRDKYRMTCHCMEHSSSDAFPASLCQVNSARVSAEPSRKAPAVKSANEGEKEEKKEETSKSEEASNALVSSLTSFAKSVKEKLTETVTKEGREKKEERKKRANDEANETELWKLVRETYGDATQVELEETANVAIGCLDGRQEEGKGMSYLGGDVGPILLALTVYESKLGGQSLLYDQVENLMFEYVRSFPEKRRFAFCAEEIAINKLHQKYKISNFDDILPSEKEILMKNLEEESFTSDVFLHEIFVHSGDFGVRKQLLMHIVRAFFTAFFDVTHPVHQKMHLDILGGEFDPNGFVEISIKNSCKEVSPVYPFKPSPDHQILLHSMSFVHQKNTQMAKLVQQNLMKDKAKPVSIDAIANLMTRTLAQWVELFGLRVLSEDLPIFKVILV